MSLVTTSHIIVVKIQFAVVVVDDDDAPVTNVVGGVVESIGGVDDVESARFSNHSDGRPEMLPFESNVAWCNCCTSNGPDI